MAFLDRTRIRAAATRDPEFWLAARFRDGAVRLEVGDERYAFEMRDGEMISFQAIESEGGHWALSIGARPEEWRELLTPEPRPFWSDLMAGATGDYDYGSTPEMPAELARRVNGSTYQTMTGLGHFP